MIAQALVAGLVTGGIATALMVLMEFLWSALRTLWPIAFVPLFITGVYAWHRSRGADAGPGRAALAGAIAGLAAGLLVSATNVVLAILADPPARPAPYWTLWPPLLDGPFFISPNVFFYDVADFPFNWPSIRTTPEGVRLARIYLTLPLFPPIGALLAGLQAWLYHLLRQQADVAGRAIEFIARSRASFQGKLRLGFVVLTAAIFGVGWLGWASVEEMHVKVHTGRAMQHFLEHALELQAGLRAYEDDLARLGAAHDERALEAADAQGKKLAAQLAHLRAIPPPAHPATDVGNLAPKLLEEGQRRLPVVREADGRFGDLSRAAGRVVELYRAGNAVGAGGLLATLPPLEQAIEAPVAELVAALDADLVRWAGEADEGSHLQQLASMLLVLLATAIAFPLGYVFSQIVVRPVTKVERGLERIGRGDFSTRVEVENRDELGELARRVNDTSRELERLYAELHSLNQNLQQRVQEALRELERSRMLRRYLPHQVADAIIASGDESILATHRREITVLFGDLRGFTAFSETAEPEVVMSVLHEYHAAFGEFINRFQGTLEHFAGDGVMVYFNDPIPAADHPQRAVRMAVGMRERVGELAQRWRRLGFELDFGVGIAIGYATMGQIGFEGRQDYGAVGSVSNLASRLSSEAKGGQILVSQRVYALVEDIVAAEPVGLLTVKGFLRPVPAYNVLGLNGSARAATS